MDEYSPRNCRVVVDGEGWLLLSAVVVVVVVVFRVIKVVLWWSREVDNCR